MKRVLNQQSSTPRRVAFTIIELMTTIGILGLLVSLLIPAVQASREAARRTGCVSNLKQIGIATNNYLDVYRVYPGISLRKLGSFLFESGSTPLQRKPSYQVLACPSDSIAATAENNQSYYFNDGTTLGFPGNGFLGGRHQYNDFRSPRNMADGLSNTAAASERLAQPNQHIKLELDFANLSPSMQRRFFHKTATRHTVIADAADECEFHTEEIPPYVPSTPYYNHILPPNRPNCLNGPFPLTNLNPGIVPARSEHPGGVNVLMGDGAVRFVGDSISRTVWWAVGTSSGGEVVEF